MQKNRNDAICTKWSIERSERNAKLKQEGEFRYALYLTINKEKLDQFSHCYTNESLTGDRNVIAAKAFTQIDQENNYFFQVDLARLKRKTF